MNTKLDLFDKDAVQQFIYGVLVENRLLREEVERQGTLKDIYYRDYVKEACRADEMRTRAEKAERQVKQLTGVTDTVKRVEKAGALLKRIIEILDAAQREGYTPETLGAAIDEELNTAREALELEQFSSELTGQVWQAGGEDSEQSV